MLMLIVVLVCAHHKYVLVVQPLPLRISDSASTRLCILEMKLCSHHTVSADLCLILCSYSLKDIHDTRVYWTRVACTLKTHYN